MHDQLNISLKHPILNNHKVNNKSLMPGLAYIDLLFQIFRENGHDFSQLELRNLSIFNPLIVDKNQDVTLNIECLETNAGSWDIRLESAQDKTCFATAEMYKVEPICFEETLSISEIKRSANKMLTLDQVYEQCRRHDLVHTGFMKAEGTIYSNDDAAYMDISVNQNAASSAKGFMFHPVLIDGSAIGTSVLLASLVETDQVLFLPLFYESFRASDLMQQQCITRVLSTSVGKKNELAYLTLEFFDQSGKKTGELKNLTTKRVRGENVINKSDEKKVDPIPDAQRDLSFSTNTHPANDVESFLCQLIAERLNKPVENIGRGVGYYEMGLDSPMLLELVKLIEHKVGERLAPTLLFEYTTIAELSEHLKLNYSTQFTGDISPLNSPLSSPLNSPFDSVTEKLAEPPVITAASGLTPIKSNPLQGSPLQVNNNAEADIAIIGIAGRYPEAEDIADFWHNLKQGKDCIREVPASRWNWHGLDEMRSPSGKSISKWGGFIDGAECFDAPFFRISPREAEFIDPQERLFLETCWKTIEDAGYTPATLVSPRGERQRRYVGVFVGVMHKDYSHVGADAIAAGETLPLSLNSAPIANRVSYFCNFHGPSMAIDTVCSSSLTAVHLAVNSIRCGESEVALAGGVNLSLHPGKYITYGLADMHSSDGYCRTFGDGGDGYVSAEGVGSVLLKPLHKAVDDHDHIYAVIKGSSINHGGTVSGFTVPSPVAQADMINACLEKTGINPRTISYVEAHGTGTSLGDPIEIQGLIKAYQQYTKDSQFCAIGSVKSNIGHAESAAGISGLSKVVLQLHYKTLVPSLHSATLNPHIDFRQSPFYVQHEMQDWKRPNVLENAEPVYYTRRAAISSFGATGSNAHIILEEYNPAIREAVSPTVNLSKNRQYIIPLSAKKQDRLQAYAHRLLTYLKQSVQADDGATGVNRSEICLIDLGYTLQLGRIAMEERIAIVATDISELVQTLQLYLDGQASDNYFKGQTKQNSETLTLFQSDEDSAGLVDQWMEKQKLHKLADLWTKGFELDWKKLYLHEIPKRMSLPTYPFSKVPYWIPSINKQSKDGVALSKSNVLHPLVQRNTSDFSGQRYSSYVTGDAVYCSDDVSEKQRILPAGAQLEMARIAISQSKAFPATEKTSLILNDVAWGKPVTVNTAPVEVHTRLVPDSEKGLVFEIYSLIEGDEKNPEIHCQGNARMISVNQKQNMDLERLQQSCVTRYPSAEHCYKALGRHEIAAVYEGADQLLVRLNLSLLDNSNANKLEFLPGLFELILVASANDKTPGLPVGIQSLQYYGNDTSAMWAHITGGEDNKNSPKTKRLDVKLFNVNLFNEKGELCVRITGFSYNPGQPRDTLEEPLSTTVSTLMFQPDWVEEAASVANRMPEYEQHLVLLCGLDHILNYDIEHQMTGVRCLTLKPTLQSSPQSTRTSTAQRYEIYALQVFDEVQKLLKSKPMLKVLVQIVMINKDEEQLFAGLSGMLNTARLENPKFSGQLIKLDTAERLNQIVTKLKSEACHPTQHIVQYSAGKRLVLGFTEVEHQKNPASHIPWKNDGIYLLTGGVGGLGKLFAKEIASQVKNPVLILTGRSTLTKDNSAYLSELKHLGASVNYIQVDVTSEQASVDLIKRIQREFGALQGIIHSAGVIHDNFIINKSSSEFQQVLAPKVSGLVHLDKASENLDLDLFILFSSGASVFGNLGQADYASANGFMDAYAAYRNQLVASKLRQGHTLSVNWPLWKDGGMHVSQETETLMMQTMGMSAMRTQSGIQALYDALNTAHCQVLVLEGNANRIRQQLRQMPSQTSSSITMLSGTLNERSRLVAENPRQEHESAYLEAGKNRRYTMPDNKSAVSSFDANLLLERTLAQLKVLLGEIIKLDTDEIAGDELLEAYGIDSLMITQLNQKLAHVFGGELSKTLFYEYHTLDALSEYLVSDYTAACLEWGGSELQSHNGTGLMDKGHQHPELVSLISRNNIDQGRFSNHESKQQKNVSIAIIGMSGQFPQAKNLNEYWHNLLTQRNCISEISDKRWKWQDYFHENRDEAGMLGKSYTRWGAFLEGFDQFDPLFFNISPREAVTIDPQERLFIAEAWRAFEDAGYVVSQLDNALRKSIGVYGGITKNGFNLWNTAKSDVIYHTSFSSLVNRVSHYMNLQGPSVPIDSMCSSALVALHQACDDLAQQKTMMALVGAVNLYLHPSTYVALSQGQLVSSTARSDVFGEGGNGFVPSEGVGVVVLKRLSDAERDNDNIIAVIKGSAVNHNGRTNGYGVPNPQQQAAVIQQALDDANVDPETIGYIEAAANGSEMGDAIEITALNKVFKGTHGENRAQYRLGSVKSILGHGESVSGMAQLFKVLLQLKHKTLCPMTLAKKPNPNINFDQLPFGIQTKQEQWPALNIAGKATPRRAGINSFGAGGVNAHLIIEEYDDSQNENYRSESIDKSIVFVLSAKTKRVLSNYRTEWKIYLKTHANVNLTRIAFSLQNGRESMKHRFACVVNNKDELINCLDLTDTASTEVYTSDTNNSSGNLKSVKKSAEDQHRIEALVAAEIEAKNLTQLAKKWVQGIPILWKALYSEVVPKQISQLPNYPFSQKRYWVSQGIMTGRDNRNTNVPRFIPLELTDLSKHEESSDITFISLDVPLGTPLDSPRDTQFDNPIDSPLAQPADNIFADTHVVPIKVPSYPEPAEIDHETVLNIVRNTLFDVLYLDDQDEVDYDTNFSEIGVNSINIVTFVQALNQAFNLTLRETIVFDYQSISDLAGFILSELTRPNELAI